MNIINIKRIMVMVMVVAVAAAAVTTTAKAVNKERISLRNFSINL